MLVRVMAGLSCLALAAPVMAQSYQTALPLSQEERRQMEVRLGAVLDTAGTDEVTRVRLPNGTLLAVRTYRPVMRGGEQPCRGYRIDVLGGGRGPAAVDGFRCRRTDGRAWVMTEPEIVLAQGAPFDLGQDDPRAERPFEEPIGNPDFVERFDDPAYDGERRLDEGPQSVAPIVRSGEIAPVPRPAPRQTRTAFGTATDSPQVSTSGDDAVAPSVITSTGFEDVTPDPNEAADTPSATAGGTAETPDPATSRVVAAARAALERDPNAAPEGTDPPATAGLETTVAPVAEAQSGSDTQTPPAAPDTAAADTTVDEGDQVTTIAAVAPTLTTRVVGERVQSEAPGYATDTRVVAALRDLYYLGQGADASPSAVQDAVGRFALDERFALPVETDALLSRLDDALSRSQSLPACSSASAPSGMPCLEPQSSTVISSDG
ncbi:MAG: hypothetical protein AAGD34_22475 [Pseudomonadota bacterium]